MKCVLGYGIAGALMKYFSPDLRVISDDVAGKNISFKGTPIQLGPRYVYYSKQAADLLDELGLDSSVIEVKVGYMTEDGFTKKLTEKMLSSYNYKVRGTTKKVEGSMSDEMSSFSVFATSQQKLFEELSRRVHKSDFIKAQVRDIDLNLKMMSFDLSSGMHMSFDSAVSTLPLPLMKSMHSLKDRINYNFVFKDIYLKQLDAAKTEMIVPLKFFQEADIIYLIGKNTDFYRVSKTADEDIFVGESVVDLGDCYKLRAAKISNPKHFDKLSDHFWLLGRYAQWDNKMRTTEVIERAKDVAKAI